MRGKTRIASPSEWPTAIRVTEDGRLGWVVTGWPAATSQPETWTRLRPSASGALWRGRRGDAVFPVRRHGRRATETASSRVAVRRCAAGPSLMRQLICGMQQEEQSVAPLAVRNTYRDRRRLDFALPPGVCSRAPRSLSSQ